MLKRHDYPGPGRTLVAEAATLAALLGSSLKSERPVSSADRRATGRVSMLLVDFDAPSNLRALARFDERRLEARRRVGDDLLGKGHLAFTIEPDGLASRYQGVVELDGRGLQAAAAIISSARSRSRRWCASRSGRS